MSNPVNSVDLHDPAFLTTHLELLTKKQDFIPTTRAQSQQRPNEHWGDFVDDFIKAMQAQGLIAPRLAVQTTNAVAISAGIVLTVIDGGAVRIDCELVGRLLPNDLVYVRIRKRFQRSGGTILVDTDELTVDRSTGGTLTTATADLVVSGNDVIVQVTGEAATTIDWQALPTFLQVFQP